ncbi:MAG: DUF1207 domain-containing protein [Deltaproteobacteria bacterium]|nr:DUF1207 domain-containing protein [Deltaproteobacteria bacterium]
MLAVALLLSAQAFDALPSVLAFPVSMGRLREARMSDELFFDFESKHFYWDLGIGGRTGVLRWDLHEGAFQLDAEAAVFARLDLERNREVLSADFLGGFIVAYDSGDDYQLKLEYRHVSSHLVDEYFETFAGARSNEYSRDAFILGMSAAPVDFLRIFSELGFGFVHRGPAGPWHFNLGLESASSELSAHPFVGLWTEISEDSGMRPQVDFQVGVEWRSEGMRSRLRVGVLGFFGPSPQLQFIDRIEASAGLGAWIDL